MTAFDDHVQRWREWRAAPWGRIRFAVVRHTLDQVLGGRGPLRVLDVGGGDGGDAMPLAVA
jgi:S-adenosylmethionine-dependent methyltransferase